MATNATSAVNAANNIGIQDFLRILSSQLNNQDPLKPLDNQEFLSQIAQFSTLQQSQQLNQKIDQLLATQASVQSIGILGKTINFRQSNGTSATGTVTDLSFPGGTPTFSATNSILAKVYSGITFSQITLIK